MSRVAAPSLPRAPVTRMRMVLDTGSGPGTADGPPADFRRNGPAGAGALPQAGPGSAREDEVQRHQLEVLPVPVVLPVLGHEDARGERRPQGGCRDVDPVCVAGAVDAAAIA